MTRRPLLLLPLLLAAACALFPGNPPDPTEPSTATPARGAQLHELVNTVAARGSATANFAPATEGEVVPEQGEVRTERQSQAQLTFSDGTKVRLAEYTWFAIDRLGGDDTDPLTRLRLGIGHVWVSLTSGQFEVKTPLGVATARGAYAEFQYDPGSDPSSTQDDVFTVDCIKGVCAFDNGTAIIALSNLQELVVAPAGPARGPTHLPDQALVDFLYNSARNAAAPFNPAATATRRPTATRPPTATVSRFTPTPGPTPTPTDTPAPTDTETPVPTDTETPFFVPPPPPDTDTPVPSDTPGVVDTDTDTPAPSDTPVPTRRPADTPPPPPTATLPPPPTATPPPPPSPTPVPPTPVPPTEAPTQPPPTATPPPPPTKTPGHEPPPTKTPGP